MMRLWKVGLLLIASVRLASAALPVRVTAQDVSLKVNGGKDYTCYQGAPADQYMRDQMEQTLLGVWMPRVIRYMESVPACSGSLSFARSQITVVLQRLDVVHQYDDILGPPRKVWIVTQGGRHYQIESYIMERARACSLGSAATQCASSPLLTPDLADLLDIRVENGKCLGGADFDPPPDCLANSTIAGQFPADGRREFGPLSDPDASLLKAALDAHAGGMCGATPAGSVQEAQDAFIAAAATQSEAHFRTPQPFTGGCDPRWTADQCCQWKALEHREYTAWSEAVRVGDWGQARCAAGRHRRMHFCANYDDPTGTVHIRMPPCVPGTYPDDTDPVSCADYLASPTP